MVRLHNICKKYPIRSGSRKVLDHVSFTLQKGNKLGILGCNGAGKSTLIRIISGAELPSSGTVERRMSVSWPLALQSGFAGNLTGFDNLRFICRIYGVSFDETLPKVEEFSELGVYMREPLSRYSAGMLARLAFAISMSVEFDCYLIDEISAVGDKRFNEKYKLRLFDEKKSSSLIMVSHFYGVIKEYCDQAAVLDQGRLHSFDEIKDATKFYDNVLAGKNITF